MPTLSAIQLDQFLEPRASKTTSSNTTTTANQKIPDASSKRNNSINTTSLQYDDLKSSSKCKDIPPPSPHLRRRNSTSSPASARAAAKMLPALYATPEPTPLPDSPTSSFPPTSPFLINHKRRGPRLLKSLSEQNVAAVTTAGTDVAHGRSLSEERLTVEVSEEEKLAVSGTNDSGSVTAEFEVEGGEGEGNGNGGCLMRENVESEDFYDPQESMSFSGTGDSDDISGGGGGGERSGKAMTPMGEFFDAWEGKLIV